MNIWNNIKAAQVTYDLLHIEQPNSTITDFDSSCIIYARDNKSRTREYKNFLIYLTNHYQLTDVTDETNLTFEKFSRKIKILIQKNEKDDNRETAKSVRKDAEDILKIVRFSKAPKTSLNDIASIIIGVAYGMGIFEDANNIEIAYQLAYQKIIRDENYLELSEEEIITQLLSYIENTSYLRLSSKGKGKDTGNIMPLILLTGIARSVSPILSAYT